MPSMRPHPLNPRPPAVPGSRSAPVPVVRSEAPPTLPPPEAEAESGAEAGSPAKQAARNGGFHESSYELQHGLQVSESEWPDDVTVPGALGER